MRDCIYSIYQSFRLTKTRLIEFGEKKKYYRQQYKKLRNQLEYLNASDLSKENERLKQRVLELEKECRTMQCQLQAVAEDESTYGYQNKFRSIDCHKSRKGFNNMAGEGEEFNTLENSLFNEVLKHSKI